MISAGNYFGEAGWKVAATSETRECSSPRA